MARPAPDGEGVLAGGAALPVTKHASAASSPRRKTGTLHYYNSMTSPTSTTFAKPPHRPSADSVLLLERGAPRPPETWRGRRLDLAGPTGYMVATLTKEGRLQRIDWKRLPGVRETIDPRFLGMRTTLTTTGWWLPKDWGTSGFVPAQQDPGAPHDVAPVLLAVREVPAEAHAAQRHGRGR